jgi:RND family efflux transporter MFP subunit
MASESELLEASMDLESAIAEREVNLAQEKQKLAGLEAAQMRLGYCTLNAPDDIDDDSYYVGVRHVDPGTLLRANEPVLTLVSIDRLKARITVIEKDYEKLHIDMQATLTTNAIPDREFPCHIVHISPIIEESSRQALVELEVPNYEYRLKPGMFIRVKLILDEHDNATTVPLEAICERNGKEGVFLVSTQSSESDEAVFTPITTGIRTYQQAEVLSPLNLTGEVVILGHHLLGEKGGSIIRAGSKNLESKKSDSPKGKTKGRGGK